MHLGKKCTYPIHMKHWNGISSTKFYNPKDYWFIKHMISLENTMQSNGPGIHWISYNKLSSILLNAILFANNDRINIIHTLQWLQSHTCMIKSKCSKTTYKGGTLNMREIITNSKWIDHNQQRHFMVHTIIICLLWNRRALSQSWLPSMGQTDDG